MSEAIGSILSLAVAAAISPFPIIGVVLMLTTPRARVNGPLFVVGWLVGLGVVGAIGLTVAGAAAGDDGDTSTFATIVRVVLGFALVALAVQQWRKRPGTGESPEMPAWMSSVDDFTPVRATVMGFVLSALNPKNLILTLAATTSIAATSLSTGDQIIVFAVYVAIATLGVGIPVATYFLLGERSASVLEDLKTWLSAHNAAIMAVILLVIGVKILGDALTG
jgi:threonine/homoserine/homoserine lactone efflux protein